ncbi:hypothetical protein OHAE_3036 [Ochrobactrum soli]|uniref:Uncharacterized protein n=1 Tax=Ochrobactrum soli TaxID=2448455 RepID=A0A2P9HG81_9HYPH|nr:hypothetical protein OHAE_3036 [[Ochrobactrum] soli]
MAPSANSTNPGFVEHNGAYDQCDGAKGDHAESYALVSELLI